MGKREPLLSEIERLVQLRDAGSITDAEFAAAKARLLGPPPPPKRRFRFRPPRIPRRVALGAVAALVVAGAAGGWYLLDSRNELRHAELLAAERAEAEREEAERERLLAEEREREEEEAAEEAEREARAKARRQAQRRYEICKESVSPLLQVLSDIDTRLSDGMTFDEYAYWIDQAQLAYGRSSEHPGKCLGRVAVPAERSLNFYIDAHNLWLDCLNDDGCDMDSIEGALDDLWGKAYWPLDAAKRGLAAVRRPNF